MADQKFNQHHAVKIVCDEYVKALRDMYEAGSVAEYLNIALGMMIPDLAEKIVRGELTEFLIFPD